MDVGVNSKKALKSSTAAQVICFGLLCFIYLVVRSGSECSERSEVEN